MVRCGFFHQAVAFLAAVTHGGLDDETQKRRLFEIIAQLRQNE
jgi:hypothetical protein